MNNLVFGPSGRGAELNDKSLGTQDVLKILCSKNLHAYEHSFTHGVVLSNEKAQLVADICKQCNITLSVHAPYYINLANPNPEMIQKTFSYFEQCLEKMKILGAKRLVFHPGSQTGQSREQAFENTKNNMRVLVNRLRQKGLLQNDVQLCPETMGKKAQIGSVAEIAELCKIDPCLVPTIDFGHINAFEGGSLKSVADFEAVLDTFVGAIGERAKCLHVHFSKIEYSAGGEKRHLNFCDEGEPNYKFMLQAIKNKKMWGEIISESAGNQVCDSIKMKDYWESLK